jgi:hypothetical protein
MEGYPAQASRMDDGRKYAYRTLLYLAMNDIRSSIGPLAAPSAHVANPNPAHDAAWWMGRAPAIANWLENLAGFSASEFEGFDEDRFWREQARACERYSDIEAYRGWFERELKAFGERASAG